MNYSVKTFKQMKNFKRSQNQIGGYQTLTCPSKIRPGAYNEVVEMHLFENHEILHSIADFPSSEVRTTALSNSTISTGIHNNPQKEKRSKKERGTADDGLLLFKGGVAFLKNSKCCISIILQQGPFWATARATAISCTRKRQGRKSGSPNLRERIPDLLELLEIECIAQAIARRRKNAVLNIRVNNEDLKSIKQKAERLGVPYQTFVSEMLHHFAI